MKEKLSLSDFCYREFNKRTWSRVILVEGFFNLKFNLIIQEW